MSPTRWPSRASAAARFADTVDLPTPPLPLEIASTLPSIGISSGVGGAGTAGACAGRARAAGPAPPPPPPPPHAPPRPPSDLPARNPQHFAEHRHFVGGGRRRARGCRRGAGPGRGTGAPPPPP